MPIVGRDNLIKPSETVMEIPGLSWNVRQWL